MPLQYQDQVSLLKDILTNHQTDCCGSVSEYEQLERLIKSLLVNSNIIKMLNLYLNKFIRTAKAELIPLAQISISNPTKHN